MLPGDTGSSISKKVLFFIQLTQVAEFTKRAKHKKNYENYEIFYTSPKTSNYF